MLLIGLINYIIAHYNMYREDRYSSRNIPVIKHPNGWMIIIDPRDAWGSPDPSVDVQMSSYMFTNRIRIRVYLNKIPVNVDSLFGINSDDCQMYELEYMLRYMDLNKAQV